MKLNVITKKDRSRGLSALGASLSLILLFITSPNFVSAHPIDEIGDIKVYDQKQILTVGRNDIRLTIDLSFYAIEKIKVWESIDKNRDQVLSKEEKETWMRMGQEASLLEVNGQIYTFDATSLVFPDYYNFFAKPPADVKISFKTDFEVVADSEIVYRYRGKDKKLSEIEFEALGEEGLKAENLQMTDEDSVSFSITKGLQNNSAVLGLQTGDRLNSFLNRYVKSKQLSASLIVFALITSFVIGALHAFTPGHGKAIVAGYLVGERGTVLNAVQLGGIITLTHTGSVFILGFAALLLTQYIVPSVVIGYLTVTSGVLIVLFGLTLLYRRTKHFLKTRNRPHTHHEHTHEDITKNIGHLTWKNLLPLGISGGIVPCVDALAILIVAISLQKILLGLVLLIFHSLGIASALIAGGVLVVVAKNKAAKHLSTFEKYEHYLSIFSALIVTGLGLTLLLYMYR